MTPDLDRAAFEDEQAIRRMVAFYSDAISHLDAVQAASLYAEDGVVSIAGHRTFGRAAIEEGLRASFASFRLLRLLAHGGLIDVSGDRARARWSTLEFGVREGADALHCIFGRYEDALCRKSEGWRFESRSFTLAGRAMLDPAKLQLNPDFAATLLPLHFA